MRAIIGPYPKSLKTERKVSIKVDDYDVWGLDHTLAMIILPCLKLLKTKKQGAPLVDDTDVPKKLRRSSAPKVKNEWDTDKFWFKRWNHVMDEMIWSFEQLASDEGLDDAFHHGKVDVYSVPIEHDKDGKPTLYEMKKGPKDTYKFDKKGYEKHMTRVNNGLRLFAMYYSSLWD